MAHYQVAPNFDVQVLSSWVEERLEAYNEEGWTHADFRERLSSFIPPPANGRSKKKAIGRSTLEHMRKHTMRTLVEPRMQAIAAYIKEDMPESDLPKTEAGVKEWLVWKTPEKAVVDSRRVGYQKKAAKKASIEYEIGALKDAVSDLQRRISALEARPVSTAKRPKNPMTMLVQEVLEANGVDVVKDELRIREVLAQYPESPSLLSIVLSDPGEVDPYSSVCLIGAMNKLVGSTDWITPRFAEIAGDMASTVIQSVQSVESPA